MNCPTTPNQEAYEDAYTAWCEEHDLDRNDPGCQESYDAAVAARQDA